MIRMAQNDSGYDDLMFGMYQSTCLLNSSHHQQANSHLAQTASICLCGCLLFVLSPREHADNNSPRSHLDQCWEYVDITSRRRTTRTQCISNVAWLYYIVLDLHWYCDVGSMLYFRSYIIDYFKVIIWEAVIVYISVMGGIWWNFAPNWYTFVQINCDQLITLQNQPTTLWLSSYRPS